MSTFQHPIYTVKHVCGHVQVKQVLEASPRKRAAVVKMLESKKCIDCILAGK